jgi:hypothetical protein
MMAWLIGEFRPYEVGNITLTSSGGKTMTVPKIQTKMIVEKAKNVLLAMLIFGAFGAYAGYQFHASLVSVVTPIAHAQASK